MKSKSITYIFIAAGLVQLSGCLATGVGQKYGEAQAEKLMKAEGMSDTEIARAKLFNTREGYTQYWKEQKESSNKSITEGLKSSFQITDNEYSRSCSFDGEYGKLLRGSFNKGAGLLLPLFTLDDKATYKYDQTKTAKMHESLTKAGLKLLPLSESERFISVGKEYIDRLGKKEAEDTKQKIGSGGIRLIGSALADLSKATTAEIYRTPYNTIEYYNEVISKFGNAAYTISLGSEEDALSFQKTDTYFKMLGIDDEKSIFERRYGMPSIDYQYASEETKKIAMMAGYYKRMKSTIGSTNSMIKVIPMEEYKNRTNTPGLRIRFAGMCVVESFQATMDRFAQSDAMSEEMNKVGKNMGLSFLTAGFGNLAQLANAKANDSENRAKAQKELDDAKREYNSSYSQSEKSFYDQLVPFIPTAFSELEVSGFIKSSRLK